jgi:ribosomal-protein-alanine N-acetyltransferase
MTRKDVARIAELEKICFRSPWSEGALRSEMGNIIAYYGVMEYAGEIIAYGGMWVFFGEAHITNVAVAPEFRGRGLGRAMMLHLMRTALHKKADAMTLEVRETNAVAQNLYASLGFEKAGERKGYYGDTGESAYIMWNSHISETLERLSDDNI